MLLVSLICLKINLTFQAVICPCIYAPWRFRQTQTTTATATTTMVPSDVTRTTNPPPDNEMYARVIKP